MLAVLSGCGAVEHVRACATDERPPIVVDQVRCDRGEPDVVVYSAPAYDIGEDDLPVVGEPLDGDFWDVRDQLDLDDRARPSRPSTSRPPATRSPRRTR